MTWYWVTFIVIIICFSCCMILSNNKSEMIKCRDTHIDKKHPDTHIDKKHPDADLTRTEFNEKYKDTIKYIESLDSNNQNLIKMHVEVNAYKHLPFDEAVKQIKLHLMLK